MYEKNVCHKLQEFPRIYFYICHRLKGLKRILFHADLADSADLFHTLHYKNLLYQLNLREKICGNL